MMSHHQFEWWICSWNPKETTSEKRLPLYTHIEFKSKGQPHEVSLIRFTPTSVVGFVPLSISHSLELLAHSRTKLLVPIPLIFSFMLNDDRGRGGLLRGDVNGCRRVPNPARHDRRNWSNLQCLRWNCNNSYSNSRLLVITFHYRLLITRAAHSTSWRLLSRTSPTHYFPPLLKHTWNNTLNLRRLITLLLKPFHVHHLTKLVTHTAVLKTADRFNSTECSSSIELNAWYKRPALPTSLSTPHQYQQLYLQSKQKNKKDIPSNCLLARSQIFAKATVVEREVADALSASEIQY